eukprot:gene8285-15794_t
MSSGKGEAGKEAAVEAGQGRRRNSFDVPHQWHGVLFGAMCVLTMMANGYELNPDAHSVRWIKAGRAPGPALFQQVALDAMSGEFGPVVDAFLWHGVNSLSARALKEQLGGRERELNELRHRVRSDGDGDGRAAQQLALLQERYRRLAAEKEQIASQHGTSDAERARMRQKVQHAERLLQEERAKRRAVARSLMMLEMQMKGNRRNPTRPQGDIGDEMSAVGESLGEQRRLIATMFDDLRSEAGDSRSVVARSPSRLSQQPARRSPDAMKSVASTSPLSPGNKLFAGPPGGADLGRSFSGSAGVDVGRSMSGMFHANQSASFHANQSTSFHPMQSVRSFMMPGASAPHLSASLLS